MKKMDVFGKVYRMPISAKSEPITRESKSPPGSMPSFVESKAVEDDMDQDEVSDQGDADDFIVDDDGAGYAAELLTESQFKKYEERQRKAFGSSSKGRHSTGLPFYSIQSQRNWVNLSLWKFKNHFSLAQRH